MFFTIFSFVNSYISNFFHRHIFPANKTPPSEAGGLGQYPGILASTTLRTVNHQRAFLKRNTG